MDINEIVKSKKFKIAVLVVGVFFVALVSFAGGVAVGFKKARFSYKFGENYERNFIGPHMRGPMGMMGRPGELMPDFDEPWIPKRAWNCGNHNFRCGQ